MKMLEEKILLEGKILPGDVLKVDSFLNHQIDVSFSQEMAKEFKRVFADVKPDKILTIEASGIAIASFTAKEFGNIPLVFGKKTSASNMDDFYSAECKSYTRGTTYNIRVAKEYLQPNEKILIIDDFLATGEAFVALINICAQAKCEVLGCGACITKAYQEGEERLTKLGVRVHSLARIKNMENGKIEFCED